jgi:hypothetical protein
MPRRSSTSQTKWSLVRLSKRCAIVAWASLLLAGMIDSMPPAHAQQTGDIGSPSGALSSGDAGSADVINPDESSAEGEEPAARVWGCTVANVDDEAEGQGNLTFIFLQNGERVEKLAYYFFFWNEQNFAEGPTSGSISRKEVNFEGSAGDGCSVTGRGAGHDWALSGKFEFHGECAKFFEGGTFSTPPFVCASTFEKTKGKWQASN